MWYYDDYIPGGGGCGHVEGGLLQGRGLVHGPGEGTDTAGQDKELVDLLVRQLVLRRPNQFLDKKGIDLPVTKINQVYQSEVALMSIKQSYLLHVW